MASRSACGVGAGRPARRARANAPFATASAVAGLRQASSGLGLPRTRAAIRASSVKRSVITSASANAASSTMNASSRRSNPQGTSAMAARTVLPASAPACARFPRGRFPRACRSRAAKGASERTTYERVARRSKYSPKGRRYCFLYGKGSSPATIRTARSVSIYQGPRGRSVVPEKRGGLSSRTGASSRRRSGRGHAPSLAVPRDSCSGCGRAPVRLEAGALVRGGCL